jgi:outer membrane protein OmpA-like peptidoglycan-associated protein
MCPLPAWCQVFVNQAALAQLAGAAAPEAPAPASKPVAHKMAHRMVKPAMAVPKAPVVVAVPVVAKPAAVLVKPAALPPVVLRFAAGSADLAPNAAAALQPVCGRAKAGGVVAVDAYAPGSASDPSVAMRLSLSRALAVRDALAACGVPAGRIVPRADGDVAGKDTGAAQVSVTP